MKQHTCKQCGHVGPEADFRSFEICLSCARETARAYYYKVRGREVAPKGPSGNPTPERTKEIDLILAILCLKQREGETLNLNQISSATGITKQAIQQIESRALRKVHYKMSRVLVEAGVSFEQGIGSLRPDIG